MCQNQIIDLHHYLNDNVNIVEIYFCPKQNANQDNSLKTINTIVSNDIIKSINAKYKNGKEETFKSYFMKDKIYTYELANDNQIVLSKHKIMAKQFSRNKPYDLFVLSSKIEKFPPYIFPCTNEIDYVCTYTMKEYRINNRISIIIKIEDDIKSVYIQYRHSPNIEIDKMNEIVNRLIKTL